ncbi:ORF111 [Agrotis segetum granulovirus]|uniref:ORF111 n=1 Tax=Agrotis segetum granulosis virus TaxID=10464 RepID=Q6QXH1_GVAS|nr:hypothetical protein AsGV125 [Agrotis segetum granulovirus]AAS82627.1 ORF111 [Agrotis segetum granulovirus]AHN92161.1 hypothetical protein AsGV122 [Agrotis segetum granulovirus]AKN63399.1 hypothetical protein AsGV125 [Agrotis segetum granulovirus]
MDKKNGSDAPQSVKTIKTNVSSIIEKIVNQVYRPPSVNWTEETENGAVWKRRHQTKSW